MMMIIIIIIIMSGAKCSSSISYDLPKFIYLVLVSILVT
jgi:hypothetical protein